MYGPGARVESGAYLLRAYGTTSGEGGVRLEVACEQGAVNLFSFPVASRNTPDGLLAEKPVRFEHDVGDLEIRVWCDVDQKVAIRGFELLPL